MGDITQQRSLDTWVNKDRPDRNYGTSRVLQVQDDPAVQGAEPKSLAFLYFNFAPPLGSTILSATLRLHLGFDNTTKPVTFKAIPVDERAYLSSMTWNTLPSVDTAWEDVDSAFDIVQGPWDSAAMVELDVTAHLQRVADGAEWRGWRVAAYVAGEGEFMDSAAHIYSGSVWGERYDYRPELHVEWSDAPDAPTQLHPGRDLAVRTPRPWLRWDYTDVSGNQQMKALQLQWDDAPDFSMPVWDSGEHAASLPEFDMGMDMAAAGLPTFDGIPDGGGLYWRVRVQDGAGLWSDWSDSVFTRYDSGGTLTLLSPSPGTYTDPSTIDNASPIVSWSLTGATQVAYRVRVWVGDDEHTETNILDTGRTTGTRTSLEVEPSVFLRARTDYYYRVVLDVWDDEDRTDVPGATAVYRATTYALLEWDAALTSVDEISAWPLDPYPMVEIQWKRDPSPEGWVIVRDGTILEQLDYADTVLPDGSHRWVDRHAPPRKELEYEVHAVVDGRTAKGATPAFVVSEPYGIWLVNDSDSVCIVGTEDGSWGMGEMSAIHEPISGDRVVQTRTGLRGYEGSVSGLLIGEVAGLEGIPARWWRDAFLRIRRGRNVWLVAQTLSLPVVIAEAVPAPTPDVEEQYQVEFSFWQRGPYEGGRL